MQVQSVGDDDDDGCHHASDVDSNCDELGVVQALDFDFTYGEGEYERDDLQQHFVAVENTQHDGAALAIAHVHKEVGDLQQLLGRNKNNSAVSQ